MVWFVIILPRIFRDAVLLRRYESYEIHWCTLLYNSTEESDVDWIDIERRSIDMGAEIECLIKNRVSRK